MTMWSASIIFYLMLVIVKPQQSFNKLNSPGSDLYSYDQLRCPQHWLQFQESCYRFIKSPLRAYNEARKICQAYEADLAAVNSLEEHGFLVHQFNWQDPQHRRWYTAAHQQSPGYWNNPVDGSQLLNMENAFLPVADEFDNVGKDYLVYSFSNHLMRWGFEQVRGDEPLLYICEAAVDRLQYLVVDERTYTYGVEVDNPEQIPRGPYFIKQPVDKTFDLSKRKISNDISLSCLAGGYPTPVYDWFREDYENDRLVARRIDPLSDSRYTLSGGMLIINDPNQKRDRGSYHCKASNVHGTIISESVDLNFGYILEFNLKRSAESGDQNWGKSLYCDPPQHFPGVKYYWARDYFPNLVEEDKRVFVSYDGALYFSALETIDRGNYSCNVQSKVSDTGRNGPFFPLRVNPHSNYQQLKFANNFPKAYPEAPIAGQEVRLECMAFGYPVPSYNWTRRGSHLPRGSYQMSYNRILNIPRVQVEDQGEYVCRVFNDRSSIENSVFLNIQAEPNFTIPLTDKHIDSKGDLTWTCEAFGIPDVNYTWWKNGRQLSKEFLEPEDKDRYHIQDNVLTIRYLDPEKDPGMYQCRARNQLKTKYSSAQLRVLSLKPSFKKRPLESESYAAEAGNITIKCNPEAAPRPKFVWKKDGNVIGSGGHRRIMDNGNLIISPVSRDDEGVYTCTASNTYGVDESRGRLIVLHGPRLVEYLQPKIVMPVHRNLGLRCQADTEEVLDVAYIWTHNGMRIRDYDVFNNPRIRIDGGYLDIVNTTFSDGGDYECIVKSAVGHISSKSAVTIHGPPGPPGGLHVINVQRTSATLQWTDGTTHGRQILNYIISGRTNWNHTWINISYGVYGREIDRYTGRKEATIDNVLVPWSVYEFRVAAVNELGIGVPSTPSPQHSTPPDRPYRAPLNIGGGGGKIGDLTITWTPLRSEEQNGHGIHYKIYWRRTTHDTEFQSLALKEYGNTGMSVVHIPEQFYYSEYDVKVQAINDIGMGPESEVVTIYSAEDMPQVAPQQVLSRNFNSTALNVSWAAIDQSRETLRGKLIGHRFEILTSQLKDKIIDFEPINEKIASIRVEATPFNISLINVYAQTENSNTSEKEEFYEKLEEEIKKIRKDNLIILGDFNAQLKYWRQHMPEENSVYYLSRSTKPWALIVGLQPDTYYFVKVMVYNAAGEGPESERYLERTYRKAPQKPPSSVHVYGVDPSTVRVVWRYVAPSLEEEPVIGYKIRVWEVDQDMSTANDTVILVGGKLEAYITDLSPGKTYHMRVLAYSNGGDGRMSSPAHTFQMGDAAAFRNSTWQLRSSIYLIALSIFIYSLLPLS